MSKDTVKTDSTAKIKTDSAAIATANEATQSKPYETTLGEQKITVFPNPTSGQLQIDITNFIEGSKGYILATDMQGRVFYKIENVNSTNKLDFSSLAKGNYTVKIVLNNTSKEWIIVKE
jgi:streptogramin lyase